MSETAVDTEKEGSLKSFLFAAVLWLPLGFFFWFLLKSVVVSIPIHIAVPILKAWLPRIVVGGGQDAIDMVVTTLGQFGGVGLPKDSGEIDVITNALVYCYNLPVLLGLVMATPLNWSRTFLQLGVGYLVLLPCQVFGLIGETLEHLSFHYGTLAATGIADAGFPGQAQAAGVAASNAMDALLQAHSLSAALIANWYQFGNLILPPVSAVIVWILFNRRFIEALTGRDAEPPRAPAV